MNGIYCDNMFLSMLWINMSTILFGECNEHKGYAEFQNHKAFKVSQLIEHEASYNFDLTQKGLNNLY